MGLILKESCSHEGATGTFGSADARVKPLAPPHVSLAKVSTLYVLLLI